MTTRLSETSPAMFVRRTLVPARKPIGAIIAPSDEIEQTKEELRKTLNELSVTFAEAELDRALSARSAVRGKAEAILVSTTLDDETLWRAVEGHRSRLEDGATTMLVLSEGAAKALQRAAPNVVSLIGVIWTTEQLVDPRLAAAIASARNGSYAALYEETKKRQETELRDATSEVIRALGDPKLDDRAWRRIGFLGRALLLEVLPTIAAQWPPAFAAATTIRNALDAWLSSSAVPQAPSGFLPKTPLAPQAIAEAIDVVENAARLLDRGQAQTAAIEILDSVLQGYAIFPGSEGRRALFDWWLNLVVPAAAALRTPPPLDRRMKSELLRG